MAPSPNIYPVGRRLRVLIVDHDPQAAETLVEQLETLGHRAVHIARSGSDALWAARSLAPDIVFLDMALPDLDDFQDYGRLVAELGMPAILLVDDTDRHTGAHIRATGAAGHVLKPPDQTELSAAIADALDGSEGPHPSRLSNDVQGPPSRHPTRPAPQLKVLVLHDHQLVATALSTMLAADPELSVSEAPVDVGVPSARVIGARSDIVLVCCVANPQAGPQIVAEILAKLPETRLLAVLSQEPDDLVHAYLQAGAVGCITQDLTPTEMVRSIKRVHAGEAIVPQRVLADLLRQFRSRQRPIEPPPPVPALARRELEVIRAVATGMSTEDVAEHLSITVHTVRTHLKNVLAKLNVHSKLEAVIVAMRLGLIDRPD